MIEKIVDGMIRRQIEEHMIEDAEIPVYRYGYILVCGNDTFRGE